MIDKFVLTSYKRGWLQLRIRLVLPNIIFALKFGGGNSSFLVR